MMLIDTAELMSVADVLPIDLKIQLIDKLLNSLNLSSRSVEAAWQEEAEKRVLEVQSGLVVPEDGEQVFADIWQRLQE
jgi:hypothetical protein